MFDDVATQAVQFALAGVSMRQRVTADNIANSETPGFTARSVSFETSLADAIAQGDPAAAQITQDMSTDLAGLNGNNVDIGQQIVAATKTTLQEQLLSGALSSQLGLISTALKV